MRSAAALGEPFVDAAKAKSVSQPMKKCRPDKRDGSDAALSAVSAIEIERLPIGN